MVHIIRDRFRAPDKVFEDWIDFDLENELEIRNRKILSFHLIEDSPSSIKMIVLFEKGVIASFKVPFRQVKSSLMNINVTANASSDKNDTNSDEDKQIEESEEYLMSLMGELEDDLWWDMLIPAFVAVVATICVWIARRLRIIQEEPLVPPLRPNNVAP